MKKKLENILFRLLSRHSFMSDHEKYLYLISLAACTYAVSMNFFLMLFHLAVNMTPLFLISLAGFLCNMLGFLLIEKGRYLPVGLLISGTVIIHTLATAICIGTKNLVIVYLLTTLVMQFIIPYASTRVRALVIGILWASMIALVFIDYHLTPLRDIGNAYGALAMFNIHLAFFGIGIQLTIGNTIWDAIVRFNYEALEKSRSEANTDPLTGLYNRRYADTFFEKLTTGKLEQVWCVAMVDIDDFKVINDAYGHLVGDEILMFISDFIKTNLRRTDLVFRWGGEEFLIVLKDAEVSNAFRLLDKLRDKLASENIETHARILNVTVTIGVCPLDTNNIEQSIEACDRLMYVGKNAGKNRVVM